MRYMRKSSAVNMLTISGLIVYSNGGIAYNGERFKNSKFLLLWLMGKEV